jgi:hypothetical protein
VGTILAAAQAVASASFILGAGLLVLRFLIGSAR